MSDSRFQCFTKQQCSQTDRLWYMYLRRFQCFTKQQCSQTMKIQARTSPKFQCFTKQQCSQTCLSIATTTVLFQCFTKQQCSQTSNQRKRTQTAVRSSYKTKYSSNYIVTLDSKIFNIFAKIFSDCYRFFFR